MYSSRNPQTAVNYSYATNQNPNVHYRSSSNSNNQTLIQGKRNVNPALTVHPPPSVMFSMNSSKAMPTRSASYSAQRNRSEIDESPIIDPRAFQYLHKNEQSTRKKTNDIESGIDTRPIINLDALTQFERRRQQQLAKNNRLRGDDDSSKSGGIDDRPIINADAFRYIEAKFRDPIKSNRNETSGIDDRPITNPDAFRYI